MIPWLIEISKKHFWRILMYGVIITSIWFFLYSAFLKPTNTTNVSDGGRVINVFEQPKQPLFNFGCANIQIEAYWKKGLKGNNRNEN